jgi:hypothetical protein
MFDYAAHVHSRVIHHWWNGTWGRMSRRDVYIRTDDDTFEVEVRLGGSEGRRWRRECPTLQAATDEAARHLADDQHWRDIAGAHRPAG